MAFIETVAPGGGGGSSIPAFTYVGGARGNGVLTITFSQAYSNVFVVSFAEAASETFTSVTFPTGSTHEEVANVLNNAITSGRAMKCYDIHNVASGTTLSTQWSSWHTTYAFTY